jgi:hypothetical protein
METNIKITLPEDFDTLCSIYQIAPEAIIQSFINQVSYPLFYSRPQDTDRWATFFFLDFLESEGYECVVNEALEDEYLRKFTDALRPDLFPNVYDASKAEKNGRAIMRQWLKAVLAERSKYITDNL